MKTKYIVYALGLAYCQPLVMISWMKIRRDN